MSRRIILCSHSALCQRTAALRNSNAFRATAVVRLGSSRALVAATFAASVWRSPRPFSIELACPDCVRASASGPTGRRDPTRIYKALEARLSVACISMPRPGPSRASLMPRARTHGVGDAISWSSALNGGKRPADGPASSCVGTRLAHTVSSLHLSMRGDVQTAWARVRATGVQRPAVLKVQSIPRAGSRGCR